MAASSASASDPHKVTRPTPIQTQMIGPKAFSSAATFPTFDRKIPDPMIDPTTTVTASNRPSTRGRSSIGRVASVSPADSALDISVIPGGTDNGQLRALYG